MSIVQARLRQKSEKSALASAQADQKKNLDNVWKGELKTVMFARKEALNRLTTGSGWSKKSASQKSSEKGAMTRSYASNIADVKSQTKSAKASLSAQHKSAKASMSSRHKSELASFKKR